LKFSNKEIKELTEINILGKFSIILKRRLLSIFLKKGLISEEVEKRKKFGKRNKEKNNDIAQNKVQMK